MNFSLSQWLWSVALDVLIKVSLVTIVGLAFTMGFGSLPGFAFLAIAFSVLNFVCLFLGCTFVVSFELFHLRMPRAVQFILSVAVANMLFILIFATFYSLQISPDDIGPTVYGNVMFGLIFAVTNLIPILMVAAGGRMMRFVRR